MCALEDNEIKLGGNGLALLAFTKYMSVTGTKDDLLLAEGLARFITAIQAKNGSFLLYKMDANGVPDTEFVSEYYPGEAMFGLARLSDVSDDERWANAGRAAGIWIATIRDKDLPSEQLPHDHWMLYALNALSKENTEPIFIDHAKRLVTAIVAAQHTGFTGDKASWNGGYYSPPRSTPAATRNEGLGAAYELFTRAGEDAYAVIAKETMARGIEFTLQTQFTRKNLRQKGAKSDALGGFHEGLDDYLIRIDYVQHNISALLAFERIRNEK
jgi:hypothetical protein